jgi:long-chain-fatty-acid--CoA ligase ACSBG
MRIQNAFGMTETSGGATTNMYNAFKLDTCNFPMPGTEMKIDKPDENGEGELCIRGRTIMMGYFKNEEATKNTIDA